MGQDADRRVQDMEVKLAALQVSVETSVKRLDDLAAKWDRQIDNFWKTIWTLVGALLLATVGPKAVDKLASAIASDTAGVVSCDLKAMDEHHFTKERT